MTAPRVLAWACCTSTIGRPCQHRQNPDGTVQPPPTQTAR